MRRPLALSLLLGLSACSEPAPPPERTAAEQRTHDSIIGASSLPGARGVAGAVRAADSADARRAGEAAVGGP
jgi:hypothetical protein